MDRPHQGAAFTIALAPINNYVVSISKENELKIWNPQTGKLVLSEVNPNLKHVLKVVISADGKYLVTSSIETIRLWSINFPQTIEKSLEEELYELIMSLWR